MDLYQYQIASVLFRGRLSVQRYAILRFCYVVTSFKDTFRISFLHPDFCCLKILFLVFVNICFVILTFFKKRNVQDARKENGLRIKTMKYFTVSLVQSTWLLAQG